MKRILILIFILGFTQLYAQNTNISKDMVILKDGSIIFGNIIDFEIGGNVELKLSSGKIFTISSNEIKKIELNYNKKEIPKDNYEFQDGVVYYNINLKLISRSHTANDRLSILRSGTGIDFSTGFRYNNLLSIGLGTGIETYGYGLNELFIPLYFDYIAFLQKTNISPFVRLQAGYGFISTTNENVIEKNGGINFRSGLGIKFPGPENITYVFDLNFKYQKANFVYHSSTWSNQLSYRDVIFRRISIRIGVIF